jgi:hypothetical protein
MPVYLWLLSHQVTPEMTPREAFKVGKRFSRGLSLLCFLAVTVVAWGILALLPALLFSATSGFLLLVFRAPLVQCEVLFYTLFLFVSLLMVDTLRRPTLARAATLGALAGVAYLTKASMLAGVWGFLLLLCLRVGYAGLRGNPIWRRWCAVAFLFSLTFVGVCAPYLYESKQRFGQYFYNVNSTFYIWYSSWEEAKAGTRAHGDRIGWPTLPAEEVPSPAKYLRDHGWSGVVNRFVDGFGTLSGRLWNSYGYMPVVLMLLAVLSTVSALRLSSIGVVLRADPLPTVGAIGGLLGYFLLAVWYQPIVEGPRIALTILMPLLFGTLYAAQRLVRDDPRTQRLLAWLLGGIALWLVVDIVRVFDTRIVKVYGGF